MPALTATKVDTTVLELAASSVRYRFAQWTTAVELGKGPVSLLILAGCGLDVVGVDVSSLVDVEYFTFGKDMP